MECYATHLTLSFFWNGSLAIAIQRPFFIPKLSYHRNVSLPVYSPILFFFFLSKKTNLHLYKRSRLSLYLFTLGQSVLLPSFGNSLYGIIWKFFACLQKRAPLQAQGRRLRAAISARYSKQPKNF